MSGLTGRIVFLFLMVTFSWRAAANSIFIPMDEKQTNHLKAYGIAYWILKNELEVEWLLNYRGGSFMCKYHPKIQNELVVRGVSFEIISDAKVNAIVTEIASPALNYDIMKLEKYPRIAVYSPKTKQPWDDAVTLVLTYAEIPYDVVFDDEVLNDLLPIVRLAAFTPRRFYWPVRQVLHELCRMQPWYIELR
jgi:hypothetical protein